MSMRYFTIKLVHRLGTYYAVASLKGTPIQKCGLAALPIHRIRWFQNKFARKGISRTSIDRL